MTSPHHAAHGRGVSINPPNRFERLRYEAELEDEVQDQPGPRTQFLKDTSRSIIATNDSPDVGFSASINPYRGCEHGCAYCYARPTHEYLGFSAGLDFESKILVKEDAPALLRRELAAPRWPPQVLGISGVTDPYQPVERRLQLTRRCLEVLAEFRNPVAIITKNHLVTRDLDILAELARHDAVVVFLSVTTLDGELGRTLEPRASQPSGRLAAIEELSRAGVPVGVMVAPIIPGLTDHEMPAILAAAAQAGARFAGYTMLRLPLAVAPIFEQWLSQNVPEKKDKVLARLREIRSGKLNDPRFGSRMRGEGLLAETIKDLFTMARKRAGIGARDLNLSTAEFRRPGQAQGLLFDC
ncbi:MAG TPA: PA0069 family radical SAM protein [Gemmataceae bacterium]|jgi:DNA repair photolyase|nr:PA0069 family radical SAM protein [Gemmataceae bacterium]